MQNAPFFVDNEVIVLRSNGEWNADGYEITHEPTRKLFARSLKRDEQGYFLSIGRETKRIAIEDTPYFVIRIEQTPEQVTLFLNDETQEVLVPETLKYSPGRLVCKIKGNEHEAKFLHATYHELLAHTERDPQNYFIQVPFGGRQVRVTLAKN